MAGNVKEERGEAAMTELVSQWGRDVGPKRVQAAAVEGPKSLAPVVDLEESVIRPLQAVITLQLAK